MAEEEDASVGELTVLRAMARMAEEREYAWEQESALLVDRGDGDGGGALAWTEGSPPTVGDGMALVPAVAEEEDASEGTSLKRKWRDTPGSNGWYVAGGWVVAKAGPPLAAPPGEGALGGDDAEEEEHQQHLQLQEAGPMLLLGQAPAEQATGGAPRRRGDAGNAERPRVASEQRQAAHVFLPPAQPAQPAQPAHQQLTEAEEARQERLGKARLQQQFFWDVGGWTATAAGAASGAAGGGSHHAAAGDAVPGPSATTTAEDIYRLRCLPAGVAAAVAAGVRRARERRSGEHRRAVGRLTLRRVPPRFPRPRPRSAPPGLATARNS